MLTALSCLLALLALAVAIPVAVLLLEVLAAVAPPRPRAAPAAQGASRPRVAVLVPAHDEGAGLLPTLGDLTAQLRAGDRLLVIADNCSDDTASVARGAGADVSERNDPTRIGKGFALDWGLRHLDEAAEIVIVVDADCRLSPDAIDRLATASAAAQRPVQALYLMQAPDRSAVNHQIAEFAVRVKNWVRPLGLSRFGLPCQLMGTGMAFPRKLLSAVSVASGQIVEDLKLGLDLALAGSPPLFCPAAVVTSTFPSSERGAQSQRQRWEGGHLAMIRQAAPRLIARGILRRDPALLALGLDLAVPPLALLTLLTLTVFVAAACLAALGGPMAALAISAVSLAGLAVSVCLGWQRYGREILPPADFWRIVSYVFSKFVFYLRMLFRKSDTQWIRTDRKGP